MARVILPSRAALADFDRIYDFIAPHNSRAAAKVLRALDKAIQLLAHQPKLGRPYRHGRHRLRLLVHGEYLVFYRERPGLIELVRVLHGKQNVPDILDEL
jgi:toxin ParE1/3/4